MTQIDVFAEEISLIGNNLIFKRWVSCSESSSIL